jgi:hypothetical protein
MLAVGAQIPQIDGKECYAQWSCQTEWHRSAFAGRRLYFPLQRCYPTAHASSDRHDRDPENARLRWVRGRCALIGLA